MSPGDEYSAENQSIFALIGRTHSMLWKRPFLAIGEREDYSYEWSGWVLNWLIRCIFLVFLRIMGFWRCYGLRSRCGNEDA